MRLIRFLILGALATLGVWLLAKPQGERSRALQRLFGRMRAALATALDRGGQMLEVRAHALSSRLRPDGQSRKIPVEGRE
jgi:hypothetical protein